MTLMTGYDMLAIEPVMPGFVPRLSGSILVDEAHGMDSSVV